jgi:hypothetical protein
MTINKLDTFGPESTSQKYTKPLRGLLGGRNVTQDANGNLQYQKIMTAAKRAFAALAMTVTGIGLLYLISAAIVLAASRRPALIANNPNNQQPDRLSLLFPPNDLEDDNLRRFREAFPDSEEDQVERTPSPRVITPRKEEPKIEVLESSTEEEEEEEVEVKKEDKKLFDFKSWYQKPQEEPKIAAPSPVTDDEITPTDLKNQILEELNQEELNQSVIRSLIALHAQTSQSEPAALFQTWEEILKIMAQKLLQTVGNNDDWNGVMNFTRKIIDIMEEWNPMLKPEEEHLKNDVQRVMQTILAASIEMPTIIAGLRSAASTYTTAKNQVDQIIATPGVSEQMKVTQTELLQQYTDEFNAKRNALNQRKTDLINSLQGLLQ